MTISHEFPRKTFPAGEKLPWWQVVVQNNAVLVRGVYRIRPKKSTRMKFVFGRACLITRGSIVPWRHAGDAGHAVFGWGSYVLPIVRFLVEVNSTTGRMREIWHTQPVIRGCDGASRDNRCI